MEVIALDPTYVSHPVADGDTVSVLFPPQGGRVIFAGARVTNLSPCVQLSGALRDPVSNQVRFENRTVHLEPQADGWAASVDADISTFSNIPVCPNQWSSQDVFDQDYQLTLQVVDREERSVARTLTVRPACNEPGFADECLCLCKQGYQLGEACPVPDAGAPGGGGAP
jgi:hypothetical protein